MQKDGEEGGTGGQGGQGGPRGWGEGQKGRGRGGEWGRDSRGARGDRARWKLGRQVAAAEPAGDRYKEREGKCLAGESVGPGFKS